MLQKRSVFKNITCLYYQLRLPKQFTKTKTNIKSGIVERIRKDIFRIIKILIFILKWKLLFCKQGCHLKLTFQVGLPSRENNNFSFFCHLLRILANLFIVNFYPHINLLQPSQRYPFLQKRISLKFFWYKHFRIIWQVCLETTLSWRYTLKIWTNYLFRFESNILKISHFRTI